MIAAKRVVRYLKGTLAYGIKFGKSQNFKLCGYSNSDGTPRVATCLGLALVGGVGRVRAPYGSGPIKERRSRVRIPLTPCASSRTNLFPKKGGMMAAKGWPPVSGWPWLGVWVGVGRVRAPYGSGPIKGGLRLSLSAIAFSAVG
ncbi:hypothetical protein T459_35731 [Capsicum annuum]|uniref:Uncharacterized protein n=1 Tax=Capsicum annuum TaxID=4072 RepID=A0A2G2V217_CAPAN|nr:hypothetical protein T459_35731 [Capsicum annuum]